MENPTKPFSDFISDIKKSFKGIFEERNQNPSNFHKRRFCPEVLKSIMDNKPLDVAIPKEYGGRGVVVKECLGLLEAASYESIPLALMFGINFALFLEPFAKYGEEKLKADIFNNFLHNQKMGGLMISEPEHGSGALSMQTCHTKSGDNFKIKGLKHWQGLTDMADYWLIASRAKNDDGRLGRDISLFVCDISKENQKIIVPELYNNNGLYPIPYGKNLVDIEVPGCYQLVPESTGLKMLMDVLHRSRMQFPGMVIGFVKRALDEATKQCRERIVRNNPLNQMDQVQYQLSQLQSAVTSLSAMCFRSSNKSSIDNNLALDGLEANVFKTQSSDLMQFAAQTLAQLQGGNGYKISSLGSRAILDSRPFRIFEGPNEMLYTQISEMVVKKMNKIKDFNLYNCLAESELCKLAAPRYKNLLNFSIDKASCQRKLVDLGTIISKVVTAHRVIELGAEGYNMSLIDNCLSHIKHEINTLVSSFQSHTEVGIVEDYKIDASWVNLF